jgi:hypothetical protein
MGPGGVREIQLTKGYVALVDAADFDWLSQWKWHFADGYARRTLRDHAGQKRDVRLHREILGVGAGVIIDHADGNPLNNSRANLRVCTARQNSINRKGWSGTGVKGVYPERGQPGKYRACIRIVGKLKYLGHFQSIEAAGKAYAAAAQLHFGDFANLDHRGPA